MQNENQIEIIQGLIPATQIKLEDSLLPESKKIYEQFQADTCCGKGIIGLKIYLIIIGAINLLFVIVSLATLIGKDEYYLAYSASICASSTLSDALSSFSSFLGINTSTDSFTNFWCNIGSFENGVLISYLIFIIIYIAFEIFSLLIHKKVINLNINGGILYYIIVFMNILFFVIFYIYMPLLFFLTVYSIIVTASSPLEIKYQQSNRNHDYDYDYDYDYNSNYSSSSRTYSRNKSLLEEQWDKNKVVPIINIVFIFLTFVFDGVLTKIKKSIILYLSMRFQDQNLDNELIKNTSMYVNGQSYNIQVKVNQILRLEEVRTKRLYKFKEIKIEGVTDNFIYVRLDNKAITDILSFTDWEYPDLNEIFMKLGEIASLIYGILFVSLPLFKLHLNDEPNYVTISTTYNSIPSFGSSDRKITFLSVFTMYGSFEFSVNNTRFSTNVIDLAFILFFMLKRIYFGGFKRTIMIIICFILTIIFVLDNIVNLILSFLMILFSIFSIVSYYNGFKYLKDDMIQTKLFIQLFLNMSIFSMTISLLIKSIRLSMQINELRKEVDNLNNNKHSEVEEVRAGFKYVGLDLNEHSIEELQIEGHPRYLYYSMNGNTIRINSININMNLNNNNSSKKNNNSSRNNYTTNNNINHNSSSRKNLNSNVINVNVNNNDNINTYNQTDQNTIENLRRENETLRETNRQLNNELDNLRSKISSFMNSMN